MVLLKERPGFLLQFAWEKKHYDDDNNNAKSCRHFIPDPIFFKGFLLLLEHIFNISRMWVAKVHAWHFLPVIA